MRINGQEFIFDGKLWHTVIHEPYNFAGRDFGWKGDMTGISLNEDALELIASKDGTLSIHLNNDAYIIRAADWLEWSRKRGTVFYAHGVKLLVIQLIAIRKLERLTDDYKNSLTKWCHE